MDPITVLGILIAKGILNDMLSEYGFWNEVSKFGVGVSAAKINRLFRKIDNNKTRINAKKIVRDVIDEMKPFLDEAGNNLDEKSINEVSEILIQTVINIEITPDLLIKHELDKVILGRAIMNESYYSGPNNPFIKLSKDQYDLYLDCVSVLADFVVNRATSLELFTEKALIKLFGNQRKFNVEQKKLKELHFELTKEIKIIRRKISKEAEDPSIEFEKKYRKALTARLDKLQLYGIETKPKMGKYNVTTAYVALTVKTKSDGIVSVTEVLRKNNRLLVRGPGGSGKTTLLQWFAVMSAAKKLGEDLKDWNEGVPFLIRLRKYANIDLPNPADFIKHNAPLVSGMKIPDDWVHTKLDIGNAIVLIDGLDELEEEQREDVEIWLDGIISLYPEAKYIITARPYAGKEEWLTSLDFIEADLQGMNVRDINVFVGKWHDAVRNGEKDISKVTELDQLEKKLKGFIRHNADIQGLVINPLLCAMICSLHRDKFSDLPSNKVDLYNECIRMFFRRDESRPIQSTFLENEICKRILLEDLAYYLLRNNWQDVEAKVVDLRFDRNLKRLHISSATGKEMRNYFVNRVGILKELNPSSFDFLHRTFQEFLAAHAIEEERDYGVLVKNADDDQWREVIILACCLINKKKDANNLISNILARGDKEESDKTIWYRLGASCADKLGKGKLSKVVKKKIQNRLIRMVPPSDLEMAELLVEAGNMIVPLLKYNMRYSEKELASCIRTLAMVGGEKALNLLVEYAKDEREEVQIAIFESAKYSNNQECYAAKFSFNYEEVVFDDKMQIELLDMFCDLKEVDFGRTQVEDLSLLSKHHNLTHLNLAGTAVKDLSLLRTFTNLTYLNLSGTTIEDISPLENLKNLIDLDLRNTKIVSLHPLVKLKNILYLNLSETEVEDISPLENLKNLIDLDLRNTTVSDLSPLVNIAKLKLKLPKGITVEEWDNLRLDAGQSRRRSRRGFNR